MRYSRLGNTYLAAKRSVSLEAIALAWLCQTQIVVATTMQTRVLRYNKLATQNLVSGEK